MVRTLIARRVHASRGCGKGVAHDPPLSVTGGVCVTTSHRFCVTVVPETRRRSTGLQASDERNGEQTRQDRLRTGGARAHPRPRESNHEYSQSPRERDTLRQGHTGPTGGKVR